MVHLALQQREKQLAATSTASIFGYSATLVIPVSSPLQNVTRPQDSQLDLPFVLNVTRRSIFELSASVFELAGGDGAERPGCVQERGQQRPTPRTRLDRDVLCHSLSSRLSVWKTHLPQQKPTLVTKRRLRQVLLRHRGGELPASATSTQPSRLVLVTGSLQRSLTDMALLRPPWASDEA